MAFYDISPRPSLYSLLSNFLQPTHEKEKKKREKNHLQQSENFYDGLLDREGRYFEPRTLEDGTNVN
jgi:hypothetical protein